MRAPVILSVSAFQFFFYKYKIIYFSEYKEKYIKYIKYTMDNGFGVNNQQVITCQLYEPSQTYKVEMCKIIVLVVFFGFAAWFIVDATYLKK